jgi:ABC-type Zn uptake system ZnuABC Zn-binding protein ZnuA
MTFKRLMSFAVIMSLALWSCQKKEPDSSGNAHLKGPRASEKLRILTTISPLYSFTKNIAGDAAEVENLLPSGAGPHDFSLSPMDAKKVTDARVLVINGVGLEAWLDKVIDAANMHGDDDGKLIVADTSRGVEVMNKDPHIWLSPQNAIIQVRNIRDALIKADPRNRDIYAANAEAYIISLNNLDSEISSEIKTWSKKEFVAYHSAFGYFARAYGLQQVAVIQETPETEPSPRHIASVVETIKAKGIKSIFTETQASHKIISSLATDLGLKVYSLDTLEKGSPGRQWYEDRMRVNLVVLGEALK